MSSPKCWNHKGSHMVSILYFFVSRKKICCFFVPAVVTHRFVIPALWKFVLRFPPMFHGAIFVACKVLLSKSFLLFPKQAKENLSKGRGRKPSSNQKNRVAQKRVADMTWNMFSHVLKTYGNLYDLKFVLCFWIIVCWFFAVPAAAVKHRFVIPVSISCGCVVFVFSCVRQTITK